MTLIKEPKKWYIKLFTLGKNFSSRTFSDNSKKFLLNAVGLFVVVTFTFYVESVGDDFENRQKYLDVSKEILSELYAHQDYVDFYIEQIDWVTELYQNNMIDGKLITTVFFLIFKKMMKSQMGNIIMLRWGCIVIDPPLIHQEEILQAFPRGIKTFF